MRREYPKWSWSLSRAQTFAECTRKYYYHYYGSHNGWEKDAPQEARAAYRLTNLTDLYLVLGEAVHRAAHHAVNYARNTEPRPSSMPCSGRYAGS